MFGPAQRSDTLCSSELVLNGQQEKFPGQIERGAHP